MILRRAFCFFLFLELFFGGPPVEAQTVPGAVPPLYGEGAGARASRLDRLLDNLAGAGSRDEARRIERSIEAIWMRSGSATADLMMRRALQAVRRDDPAAALTLIGAAIDAKPDFAEGYNKRATLLFTSGDVRRAMMDLRQALRLEPRHYGAWAGLGRVLEQLELEEQALDAYRRAYALNPQIEELKENIDMLATRVRGREI